MGIPITHDVYMPWHLGDPFKSIEQTTHMMVFTMMIMSFPQSICLCVRNPLLVSSGNMLNDNILHDINGHTIAPQIYLCGHNAQNKCQLT